MQHQTAQQKLFQNIFETTEQGILVVNDTGVILQANYAVESLFGFDKGELLNTKLETLIPQEKRILDTQLQKTDVVAFKKDSSQFFLTINLTPTIIDGKKAIILFVQDNPRDTIKLKQVSATLENEKNILNTYLNTAATLFLVINKNHTIQLINKKGCEILNYEESELIGKDWFENFIPKSERKKLSTFFDQLVKGVLQPPVVFENWIVGKGNIKKLVSWQSAVLKDQHGETTGLISSGVEVTHQVSLENALKASEEKNLAILEAIPDIMAIHDEKGAILEIHVPHSSYLKESKENLIGKNGNDLVENENFEQLKKTFLKVLTHGKTEVIEITIPGPHSLIDLECRFVLLSKKRILTISRDITQQKAVQSVLHTRSLALQAVANGIVIVDAKQPKLPIIYCNNAFMEMTGYSHEDILGFNCQFLQKDDRDQEAIKTMANAIRNCEPCKVVLRNYRKNGTLFWNEVRIAPLYGENKELTHFIGVQNDVTEIIENRQELESYAEKLEEKVEIRTKEIKTTLEKLLATNITLENQIEITKIAEEKASASRAMFIAIAQNFPKGAIIVFNTNYELVYAEGEELRHLGVKKPDIEGVSIDKLAFFNQVQKSKLKKDIKRTLAGANISSELDFQGQNYNLTSTPLCGNLDKIVWALFVFNNVTEQKSEQQKLEASLKAEKELNELKSRFVAMASHEFRTPLSAILSSAILIGKQNETGKEEQRIKHVFRIRNNVKNLVVILNDFLSLSKLEEGKVIANPENFELVQFSKSIIEEMDATKKEGQNILLTPAEASFQVFLDPKLLSHILINLLSNAIKYSSENQDIVLSITRSAKQVILTIIDKGIGIPEEEQKKLFSRFFRADNANNIQGTGLGLHIVKQYVELMGGTVSFTSKVHKETSFRVKLPFKMLEPKIIN